MHHKYVSHLKMQKHINSVSVENEKLIHDGNLKTQKHEKWKILYHRLVYLCIYMRKKLY